MNGYLYYLILTNMYCFGGVQYWQLYSNVPTYDSYEIVYGDYSWRNTSTAHVTILNQNRLCCGTLLTLEHALTVGQCFEPKLKEIKYMLVVGGSTHLREHDPRAQVRQIKDLVIHEGFDKSRLTSDDIAIIIMSSPFVETFRVKPALLPEKYYLNPKVSQRYFVIYIRINDRDIYYGKINVDGFRFKGDKAYRCRLCGKVGGGVTLDKDGFVTDKYTCMMGLANRYEGAEHFICYSGAGCPALTYNRHVVTMQTYYYVKGCPQKKVNGETLYVIPNGCNGDNGEILFIQVFPYVKWIKSKLASKKVVRFRPYKITTKKINLTPHIPLLVYITVLAIALIVFLICNRAVFGRIRF